jgi:hypothetical protein
VEHPPYSPDMSPCDYDLFAKTKEPLRGTRYNKRENVRFEVFKAVTMKNGVFWDVTPCGSCKNRRFGETWRLLHQGDKNR